MFAAGSDRMKQICATYQDEDGNSHLMIGGGYSYGGGDNSNHTWTRPFRLNAGGDFPTLTGDWMEGPTLPGEISVGAKAVPYDGGKTFLLLGSSSSSYNGEIYKFNTDIYYNETVSEWVGEPWKTLEAVMSSPREVYDAFLVPDDAVSCWLPGTMGTTTDATTGA